jgi:flagellar biosynthesis anti-sigma factor FlgM
MKASKSPLSGTPSELGTDNGRGVLRRVSAREEMRIDPQIPAADNPGTSSAKSPLSKLGVTSSSQAEGSSDTVNLSSSQTTVRRLMSELNSVPEIRQNKVDALKTELRSGQFDRASDQVAGSMIRQLLLK